MRRFIAMHESETGFESPAAVLDWFAATKEPDHGFRVVEIIVDPVTERFAGGEISLAREQGYAEGLAMARRLMRIQLGIAVPGD